MSTQQQHMSAGGYLEDNVNPVELTSGGKPEESFAQLIKRAISSSPRQRLFLTEIYDWILEKYPYYRHVDQGWRNSVRHALSTTKEFVRIKETRHRYNRGSEWCLADSNLGKWYLHLIDDESLIQPPNSESSPSKHSDTDFWRLLQLSTLIPELSSSMLPSSPDRPVLLNLKTCPDYLLGHVPHPELFVHRPYSSSRNRTPSPPDGYILNMDLPISAPASLLGSPLSRKATPKPFDTDLNEDEFLNFNL